MPELPEVETIRRGLVQHAAGQTILGVSGQESRLFRDNPGGIAEVRALLENSRIEDFDRRGKFMWLLLAGQPEAMVIHLGMSGQIRFQTQDNADAPRPKHEHLRLHLERGSLSFVDPRTFGRLTVSELDRQGSRLIPRALAHIAKDLLEPEWDPDPVIGRAIRSDRRIKAILLDQRLLSGIGNIYADEALFRAGRYGGVRGSELSEDGWQALLRAAKETLRDAITEGGTSFDALYVNVEGNPGYFGNSLAVYGQAGRPCVRCTTLIRRIMLVDRCHYYCPNCQQKTILPPRGDPI